MLTTASIIYHKLIQNLAAAGVQLTRHLWSNNPATTAQRLAPMIAQMQYIATTRAIEANEQALIEQGTPIAGEAFANPEAFAGWANRGTTLSDLFEVPNLTRLFMLDRGYDEASASRVGLTSLEKMVSTNIADAGTDAAIADLATRPRVGYVRVVGANACDLCIVLAGRFYWVEHFERHPHCLCSMSPAAYSNQDQSQKWAIDQQRKAFDALSPEQQDKRFGKAQAEAIRNGADIGQVVNERRGRTYTGSYQRMGAYSYDPNTGAYTYDPSGVTKVRTGGSHTTREGMAKGYARNARGGLERETIPSLVAQSGGDRAKLQTLLREHGYIVDRDAGGFLNKPEFVRSPDWRPSTPQPDFTADSDLWRNIRAAAQKLK